MEIKLKELAKLFEDISNNEFDKVEKTTEQWEENYKKEIINKLPKIYAAMVSFERKEWGHQGTYLEFKQRMLKKFNNKDYKLEIAYTELGQDEYTDELIPTQTYFDLYNLVYVYEIYTENDTRTYTEPKYHESIESFCEEYSDCDFEDMIRENYKLYFEYLEETRNPIYLKENGLEDIINKEE